MNKRKEFILKYIVPLLKTPKPHTTMKMKATTSFKPLCEVRDERGNQEKFNFD